MITLHQEVQIKNKLVMLKLMKSTHQAILSLTKLKRNQMINQIKIKIRPH